MPVMNGIDALKEIKKTNQKIPIIAVTAFAQTTDKKEIMQNPFDDYISKPIDQDVLFTKVSSFVKN